jgi:4-hydroxy-tetrahydrodipicolinate synthase
LAARTDKIARADVAEEVVKLRGAEGGYAEALQPLGPCDGWPLSTGNSFPAALRSPASDLATGRIEKAREASKTITQASECLFAAAAAVRPSGSAFANANRATDHVLAHGARWAEAEPPLTLSGKPLPRDFLAIAAEVLEELGVRPGKGYLAQ